MQTCSLCNAQSPDTADQCSNCKSDLREYSTTTVALNKFKANPRVEAIILSVAEDACPVCQQQQGAYPKDQAPTLPTVGCSHALGCRCFYQPILSEIFP
jgi:RNA polymerase subunit RPABC4/transcription elongation factor Spt4